jgi:hypothetical protein
LLRQTKSFGGKKNLQIPPKKENQVMFPMSNLLIAAENYFRANNNILAKKSPKSLS